MALNQEVISLAASSPDQAQSLHFGEERSVRKDVLDPSVNELVDLLDNDVNRLKDEIHQYGVVSEWIIGAVTILSVTLGIWLSILLLRSILLPLKSLNKQLEEIAQGEGDLTKEIVVKVK